MNIKSFLIVSLIVSPIPAFSQQVNNYPVCTNYQENYVPGYYDRYGNYVQGTVYTQRYNVPCSGQYQTQVVAPVNNAGYCSPARTTLGGLLGGGIAAIAAKKSAWSWAIPLGAVLGTGAANATCN